MDLEIMEENNSNLEGDSKKVVIIVVSIIVLVSIGIGWWMLKRSDSKRQGDAIELTASGKDSEIEKNVLKDEYPLANQGDVSPISGLACDNWNRRPVAVMQPSDVSARPLAGLSEADIVFEMPVLTTGKPRLMGVYVCGNPPEIGSIRSSRHDFIHLAKGLDAIYTHWGGSIFAKDKLNMGVIENINCNNDGGKSGGKCCFRKEGISNKREDSGYVKFAEVLACAEEFGYRLKNQFSGYDHQGEAPLEDRIEKGYLRVGLGSSKSDYYVEYIYDKETNSYKRSWGGVSDLDRNTKEQIAPKNVVVMTASQEEMEEDPHYNNVQLGDPWYDDVAFGEAHFYFNGMEIRGKWRKDKSAVESKLIFLDENDKPIKFVPGQIWVEVLEPGRALKWKTEADLD